MEQIIQDGAYWSQYFMSSYLTPFVMLYAMGIFQLIDIIVKKYESKWNEKIKQGIINGSKLSMGVFYIHMLVLTALEYTGWFDSKSFVMLTIKVIITI